MTSEKMKVDVWSDIMCPFCYIGKRNYESALVQFANRNEVEIVWHSFQLDPTIPSKIENKRSVYDYLAVKKGMTYEQSVKMHERVIEMAKKAGLNYHFEKAQIANSFRAHRVIQLAKAKGLGDAIEERLFFAYFTEGKDLGDPAILIEIGKQTGLSEDEVKEALTNEKYSSEVDQDIMEARDLGIGGVPFFVFNRRYAVSGAQPPQAFLQTLQKSFSEWKGE